jgi:hypothetical protein
MPIDRRRSVSPPAQRGLALLLAAALAAPGSSACVFIAHRVRAREVDLSKAVTVSSPVKAHLKDGSTVVYAEGVSIEGGQVRGLGRRYDVGLRASGTARSLPIEEIVAMESFHTEVDAVTSVALTAVATPVASVGAAALAVAIFGSCPTVYSEQQEKLTLEAETFSSSVAPLLEARDVDRLHARPDADGRLRLEVRNEALETHSINHLELLEVSHAEGERVAPDVRGRPLLLRDMVEPDSAVDRAGRDLRETLRDSDEHVFETAPRTLDAARVPDLEDWIDLTVRVPGGGEHAALMLRMRNSLLNTVLFYEEMLAAAGPRALDWLARDLARISDAVELGRFVQQRLGARVSVWRDGSWQQVARIPDAGPIAWHDVAVVVPVAAGEASLRIRVSFVVDAWRIDRLAVARSLSEAQLRRISVAKVEAPHGSVDSQAADVVRAADARYLTTTPGQRFFVTFETGAEAAGRKRTFLLASQGYYVEWIRRDWLKNATSARSFVPSDEAMASAIRRWRRSKGDFEDRFERTRIPVS